MGGRMDGSTDKARVIGDLSNFVARSALKICSLKRSIGSISVLKIVTFVFKIFNKEIIECNMKLHI